MKVIDMSGQVFGRLSVVRRSGSDGRGLALWLCRCECGAEKIIPGRDLRQSRQISCGCLRLERLKRGSLKHGMTGSTTWSIWRDMRKRCSNPKADNFIHYGGRGISVCDRWQEFSAFFSDMGERPEGMSLERKDVNGNYEPDNCIWIPAREQPNNTRRSIMVEIDGKSVCLKVACSIRGLPYNLIRDRIRTLGWSVERAMSEPKKINGTTYA